MAPKLLSHHVLTLSEILRLARIDPRDLEDLRRAESLAPRVIKNSGLLLVDTPDDETPDLFTLVFDEMLTSKERALFRAHEERLATLRQKGALGHNLASDAYTPQITAAYFLGLALGWHAAATLGEAR